MPKIRTEFKINNEFLPFDIYLERRRGLRIAFGRDTIIVRIPAGISQGMQKDHLRKAKEWVLKKVTQNPSLTSGYKLKMYHGSKIEIMGDQFHINIKRESRDTGKIVNKGKGLEISIPHDITKRDENILIKKLLSRCMGSIYTSNVKNRVLAINKEHFQKSIKAVRLKYNKSNWGSCSSQSNINLSTRLLLVPDEVRDYVIIHELSHLIEMNHSKRFWKIVEKVCPQYKVHEKWLDEFGINVDF